MFLYAPSKGSCWGAAIEPRIAIKAIAKTHAFLETYFEPIKAEKLTLNLNPHLDKEHYVPVLREKVVQVFGRPGRADSLDWVLQPSDYPQVMNLILGCHIEPKLPADPVWLSFTCKLTWKRSALPELRTIEEAAEANKRLLEQVDPVGRRIPDWATDSVCASPVFMANLRFGGRFMFPLCIQIPISPTESSSYEFLRKFSADAPFKMNPKRMQVLQRNQKGGGTWRRPNPEIAAWLNEVI